jgi:DNA-binding MarR family transcriptional regulator
MVFYMKSLCRVNLRFDKDRIALYSTGMNSSCGKELMSRGLVRTLLQAASAIEGRLEAALDGAGLSLAKLGVLDQLMESGEPLALSRLAERLCCVKSNMTQLIDRLEEEGLVERTNHPQDRRTVLAAITKEGQRRYEIGRQTLLKQEQEIFKSLKKSEREQLLEVLESLRAG